MTGTRPGLLAAAAAAFVAAAPVLTPAQDAPAVAIRNARIVPVSGPVIDSGTIVVSGGLIRAVGARVDVPPEAAVLDGAGLTVYPGLIDAMTDRGLATRPGSGQQAGPGASGQPGGASSGSRPARGPEDRPASTPWVQAADEFRPDSRLVETWRHGGFTSLVSVPSNGILPGQAAVVNLSGAERGEAVVRTGVALPVVLRAPGGFGSFPGSLMGVIAYVRQVFSDTRHYGELSRQYEANPRGRTRPEYDRTVVALHDALTARMPALLPANTTPEVDRAIRLGSEIGLPVVVYGAHEAADAAATLAREKVPVLVNADWPDKPKDGDPEAPELLRDLERRERAPATPAVFAERNVTFAFYSGGLDNPKEVLSHVRAAIDAGLSRDAALRALTLSPSRIFGVADRLGTLEPGKIANLVVTRGDLFDEDVTFVHVFVDGVRFDVPPRESTARPSDRPHATAGPRAEGVR